MSEGVLASIITGVLSLVGVIITVAVSARKSTMSQRASNAQVIAELRTRSDASDAKLDKEIALLRAEVDELMREVREHNNFARRMPVVEQEIKTINREIEELKEGVKS